MIEFLNKENPNDIEKLRIFSSRCDSHYFRYYKNRNYSVAVLSHISTLLDTESGMIRGYAHIDYDKESGRNFIGLYVFPEFQNCGIGSTLLKKLIEIGDSKLLTLYLTVDKSNFIAKHLYEKFGFLLVESKETYDLYSRIKNT